MKKSSQNKLPTQTRQKNHGQELVEYALTLPLLVMFLMAILDMGRGVYYYSAIYNAAREGARFAVIQPGNFSGIDAAARRITAGLNQTDLNVSTAWPGPTAISVVVTYRFTPVTPIVSTWLGSGRVTLTSQATMQLEQ